MGRRLLLAALWLLVASQAEAASTVYLRDAETNGLTFSDGGTFTYKDASTTAGSSAATTGVTSTVLAGNQVRLTKTAGGTRIRWISCPLNTVAVPVGATFTFTLYGFESDALANATWYTSVARRIASSGATLAMASNQPYSTELGTTNAAQTFTATMGSAVTFLNQDRLVVDLRLNPAGGTMAAGYTVTMTYDKDVAAGAESKVVSSTTLSCFVSPTTTPTPTATATKTVTPTPVPTPTFPALTQTRTPTPTPTPTLTVTPTPSPTPTSLIPQGDIEPFRLRAPQAGPRDGQVPCYTDVGGHFRWCDRGANPTATSVTPTMTPTLTPTATPTLTVTPVACVTAGGLGGLYGAHPELCQSLATFTPAPTITTTPVACVTAGGLGGLYGAHPELCQSLATFTPAPTITTTPLACATDASGHLGGLYQAHPELCKALPATVTPWPTLTVVATISPTPVACATDASGHLGGLYQAHPELCKSLLSPTPTASPTPTPTVTISPTPLTCPTNADGTGVAQQGEDGGNRPICAPTSTASPTPTATVTQTPATVTPTTLATFTRTPTPTITVTPVATPTTPAATQTATLSPTPTTTATPNAIQILTFPIQYIPTSVDGTTWYFSFSTGISGTESDVSWLPNAGGYLTFSGAGFGQVRYYISNFVCGVTPAPGKGSSWQICLRDGAATACTNLGFEIHNTLTSNADNALIVNNLTLLSFLDVQIIQRGTPLAASKLTCSVIIRYAPSFLP